MPFKEKLKNFFLRFQKISLDEKIFFAKNLVVMIKAGLPLTQSVGVLSKQTKNKKFKAILENIQNKLESGSSLAESLAANPDVFSEIFINMVEAGEKSGQLEKVLEEIADQMKKTRELSSKLKRALTYPIFIIGIMILVGIFSFIFVIPKMMTIFEEMKIDLPLPTRILIFVSKTITQKGYIILGVILLIILVFWKIIKTKRGRYFFHSSILKLPIVGLLVKKVNIITFARTFSSLLSSGIPLVQTFQITAKVLSNVVYQEKVAELSIQTSKGVTISNVLQKYPELFPLVISQMIEVGEKTGTLENILEDIIEFYEDDVSETLSNFTSIIEPFLIVILGIGVAIMALAVITPMYSLVQTI